MKKVFGLALLALPFLAVSAQAEGHFFNVQAGGSWYLKGGPCGYPQAGPWYLYWPLEAHFVAPAPTGYPYWPGPQVLPKMNVGGPTVPPLTYAPPPAAYAPAPPPAVLPAPAAVGPTLQPTSYYPTPYAQQAPNYYSVPHLGQAPSYWYDR